jgi:hypothetical protein
MAADPDLGTQTLSGDPIVEEATKRFKRCVEWESTARENFLNDYKFRHGDAYNGYQWPNRTRNNRELDARPCLTMNITRQHNLQITNEALQNKSSVAFRATGGSATKASANLHEAMFRRVEYLSDAQSAYETACGYQVDGGIGWVRLVTVYEDNRSFNQDMRIKRVRDPLSVYMDMDCQEENCSDAKYAFVFDLVPDGELEEAYPGLKELMSLQPLGGSTQDSSWNIKDHTRVCEYFRKVTKKDTLLSFIDPATQTRKEIKKSQMPPEVYKEVKAMPLTRWRPIEDTEIQWYLIVGQEVVDKTIWPGAYIPLIKVAGEETIVEGILDRKGHTRAMLDANRMYNYNASASVEFGALQSKTPWIAAAKAIEEYESMWNSANRVNHSVLIYNHVDDEGTPIAPPVRTAPPTAAPVFESGMQTAFNQMMMTSGQWQNQMGMGGNERTGEAISRRQEQGYTAVYHFQNNYAKALRYIGKQWLDLAPKIYDTKRLMMLKAEDGSEFEVELDPASRQALLEQINRDGEVVKRILNPRIGQYDVEAEVGPAYGTRREETVKAMTLLLTQAPTLTGVIGDLLLNAMNFKEAGEAAQRLKRMVPPQALGKGPTQAEAQLQARVTALTAALAKTLQKAGKDELKLLGKDELRDIEVFDAETKRMAALKDQLPLDKEGMAQLVHQLVSDSLATHLSPILEKNEEDDSGLTAPRATSFGANAPPDLEAGQPPVPGAKKAPDGQWYVADPTRKGKYLRVRPAGKARV